MPCAKEPLCSSCIHSHHHYNTYHCKSEFRNFQGLSLPADFHIYNSAYPSSYGHSLSPLHFPMLSPHTHASRQMLSGIFQEEIHQPTVSEHPLSSARLRWWRSHTSTRNTACKLPGTTRAARRHFAQDYCNSCDYHAGFWHCIHVFWSRMHRRLLFKIVNLALQLLNNPTAKRSYTNTR